MLRRPLLLLLPLAVLVFASGVSWGLPSYEDWQSDSLTPYHPLVGLTQLYSFGYFRDAQGALALFVCSSSSGKRALSASASCRRRCRSGRCRTGLRRT
jgi:hypothetical protein